MTYFAFDIQISRSASRQLDVSSLATASLAAGGRTSYCRRLADRLHAMHGTAPSGASINIHAVLNNLYRMILVSHLGHQDVRTSFTSVIGTGHDAPVLKGFIDLFPPAATSGEPTRDVDTLLAELVILWLSSRNPAVDGFRTLFDDREFDNRYGYRSMIDSVRLSLRHATHVGTAGSGLLDFLLAPSIASPGSLQGQVEYVRTRWNASIPHEMLDELMTAVDILREEELACRHGGPGPARVIEFGRNHDGQETGEHPEFENYTPDSDWMSNVVLIAKMAYVWMFQLSRQYRRPIERLDQIPDEELDRLQMWGFTGLWLIGIWRRSDASRRIKHITGNIDAAASAYSLFEYEIADEIGGDSALDNLRSRCKARGIRLACDMVPNHTGIFSRWIVEHPEWFVQLDHPPYPDYRYTGEDLSQHPDISIRIEDGYWSRTNAAVTFEYQDRRDGRTRYIYHGNDGTSTPWNDTAQLDYLREDVRQAVVDTILHVARHFSIIRFDAAMTLSKRHYQRLWHPRPGHGGSIPSRAGYGVSPREFAAAMPDEFWREVVQRVQRELPDTLLLAEAFWLMEGYFVRTLGMHRVYNSAFMNMLKMEENAKYRQTIRNVLEFDPQILQRFVNFMNNPDELTAIEQFGHEGKYLGVAVMLVSMPGLPMFGHGQIEGFHEKYGMEYRRAYWDEQPDLHLVSRHEQAVFPLMRRRSLFSGSENFLLYDFIDGDTVNEDVFAYSNRRGTEHAVIVYHNRFARTAGWIRQSAAFALKQPDGTSTLSRMTLSEALDCGSSTETYFSFSDHATGLEFVRSGAELAAQGLYVELGPYEYHVFLDFRTHVDHDGEWSRLHRRLGGKGVPSIEREFELLRHEPVMMAFSAVTKAVAATFSGDQDLPWREAACSLYSTITSDGGDEACTALAATASRIGTLPDPSESLLLAASIVLGNQLVPTPSGTARQHCLDHAFSVLWTGCVEDGICGFLPAEAAWAIVSTLADRQHIMTDPVHLLSAVVDSEQAGTILHINHHNGTDWFNRERFELLVTLIARLSGCPDGSFAAGMLEIASSSGYDIGKLSSLLHEFLPHTLPSACTTD